jgi:RNA polymerase sigma-70 factor (ECF subfamily)
MSEDEQSTTPHGANQWFTTTHWSVVVAGGDGGSPRAAAALEDLCRTYWYPLYAYVRRRGHPVEEAQDLTQEFFARLIEKRWIADADRSKGRFRTFLLTALNHFLANEWRRSQAAKRGGAFAVISLDDTAEGRYAKEAASDLTPEKIYERRWALSLFELALIRLRDQYESAGKAHHFDCLKPFLSIQASDGEYDRVAMEVDMSTGAVAAAVHRLRQHYRTLVRDAVAQTVKSPAELEEEMRWLLNALN